MATHLSRSVLMHRELHRLSLSTYGGPVFTWDVDNTYLITPLESVWAMMGVAFEFAIDKRPVAGATWLLREIRRSPVATDDEGAAIRCPIFFISASPAQLRTVFERRMLLDGVEYDGITLRNWVGLLAGGRLRPVRTAFAYKIAALLENRLLFPGNRREFLFGDDLEQDAQVYQLYAQIVAGETSLEEISHRVRPYVTWQEDGGYILDLVRKLWEQPERGAVEAAFIRCVRNPASADDESADADQLVHYAANMLDIASQLNVRAIIDSDAVHHVALGMLQDGWSEATLEAELRRLRQRGRLTSETWSELKRAVEQSLGRTVG